MCPNLISHYSKLELHANYCLHASILLSVKLLFHLIQHVCHVMFIKLAFIKLAHNSMLKKFLELFELNLSPAIHCFFNWWNFANYALKNMISTHTKHFSWEKWPKFARFRILKIPNSQALWQLPEGSQEYRMILFFFLTSYLLCSQIWQNYFLDDRHFGYITKSLKETLLPSNDKPSS
jgi:hypothetical protein